MRNLSKRDFLFESTISKIYIYFVNFDFEFINIQNNKNISLKLNNRHCINCIIEYKNEKCYAIKEKNYSLAIISLFKDYSILFKLDFIIIEIYFLRKIIFKKIETQLNNNIIIYKRSQKIAKYIKIIEQYSHI